MKKKAENLKRLSDLMTAIQLASYQWELQYMFFFLLEMHLYDMFSTMQCSMFVYLASCLHHDSLKANVAVDVLGKNL